MKHDTCNIESLKRAAQEGDEQHSWKDWKKPDAGLGVS